MDIIKSFLIFFPWLLNTATPSSIEKHLLDSAKTAEMFDLFHVMPDGMMKTVHELDMLLSIDQYKALYMDDDDDDNDDEKRDDVQGNKNNNRRARINNRKRNKRKAAAELTKRWPNCLVYYEITPSLGTKIDKSRIKEAIKEWEKYTCLRFIESDTAKNRIRFMDGDMCASPVGMQNEAQELHLASGCRTLGIMVHEIGHAVGWYHEHMRPDRDDYLNVHFSAIPSKYRPNYKKYSTDIINTYNIPYDYTSIMHYGETAFPGSMKARDPRYQKLMGQRDGLSFKDIKLANVMYNCAQVMKCSLKDCEHDGFQFYKSFKGEPKCQCWCDSGDVADPLILCSKRKSTPAPPVVTLPPPTSEPDMECMDVRSDCKELKKNGKCMTKIMLMMGNCAKTCGFCGKGKGVCMDYEPGCGVMSGRCKDPGLRSTMSEICMASCDLCQSPPNPCDIHEAMLGDYHNHSGSRGSLHGVFAVIFSLGAVIISAVFIGS